MLAVKQLVLKTSQPESIRNILSEKFSLANKPVISQHFSINGGFFVCYFVVTFYIIKKASAAEKQSSTVIVEQIYYAFSGYLSWGTEKA